MDVLDRIHRTRRYLPQVIDWDTTRLVTSLDEWAANPENYRAARQIAGREL